MEQLIAELYSPANQSSPDRIAEIQREIQHLQRQQTSWQLGLDLLGRDNSTVRFYGAHTLIVKINACWDDDQIGKNDQMRSYLLESLVSRYLQLSMIPDVPLVLQKLCSALTTLFVKPDSNWPLPIRHVLACFLSGHYVAPNNLPKILSMIEEIKQCSAQQMAALILLIKTFAEDLASLSSTASDEGNLQARVAVNCYDVWLLMQALLDHLLPSLSINNHLPANPSPGQASELVRHLMKAIPFWASRTRHAEIHADNNQSKMIELSVRKCIQNLADLLDHDNLSHSVLQLLISLQQTYPRLISDAINDFPAPICHSRTAQALMTRLVSGNWDADDLVYVEFLEILIGQVDTTNSHYLRIDTYNVAFQQLQQLLRCDGVAAVEDLACQVAVEKVSQMVEGFIDWDPDSEAEQLLHDIAADACQACLVKVRMPLNQMSDSTMDWEPDERAKFQDFRYDVFDFFQSAFSLLGKDLIEETAQVVLRQEGTVDWSIFEAGMFIFTAFSDTMSSDPEIYDPIVTAVLNSAGWTQVLNPSAVIPDKARRTSIRFVTENTGYLQRHSTSLFLILNFLFSSLHFPGSATPASRAVYSLCDSQRSILAPGLPQFMAALDTIGDLGETERHRIYAAVGAVIQALPDEITKAEPLSRLLSAAGRLISIDTLDQSDTEAVLTCCTDAMQTLASIGKGSRAPSETPIDLDSTVSRDRTIWLEGKGASVQSNVLQLYSLIVQKVGDRADNGFIEACCEFVRSGFTEQHPSPFKFSDSVGADLVIGLITLENPNIDCTMACASSFVASIERDGAHAQVSRVWARITDLQQCILTEYESSGQLPSSSFLSSSLDFLTRLFGRWNQGWFQSPQTEGTFIPAMVLGLLVLSEPDTLPRRAAAAFFGAFADVSATDHSSLVGLDAQVKFALERFSPEILGLILRLIGGECARSELENLAECLRRFTRKQAILTKQILREAVKDESRVLSDKALKATTLEQRHRFLGQIDMLRGSDYIV
ncbi:hypothetical protein B0A52_08254 [Exophiala mesophila]|uniref:Importin N-terminal domain-containing protein n=1 Tax=Exophiala mesophila TaxID=212818 RepID=A0A438MYC1_EXOME|nr:hypothetical protein B0A52_08254 [Exophiala mesophila]